MASKTFGRFLLKTFGVLLFCAVSGYALFLAYGYNLDLQNRHIEKTSIIDVVSRYRDIRVYMDDRIIGNALPLQIKDLLPGSYQLAVSKLGYLPWKRLLSVRTDIVTKVDDVVLVPENLNDFTHQLVHFPDESRYFWGKDFFIVQNPNHDYLTLVYLLEKGTMKEEELKLSRQDIGDITHVTPQSFLVTFQDGSYEWVEFSGPKFVDFHLPQGSSSLQILPGQGMAYFLKSGNLYRVPVSDLASLNEKTLPQYLLAEKIDQFDAHDHLLVYLSRGKAFVLLNQEKTPLLVDRSGRFSYIKFIPSGRGNSGVYVARTKEGKRLAYAVNDKGFSTLLTPQLSGEVFGDGSGRFLLGDGAGNIFLYKSLLDKKILVTTQPVSVVLRGFLLNDGHFLFERDGQIHLADATFSNVYPLFAAMEKAQYFLRDGALFTLENHKLKSLFFLPVN